VVTIGPIFDRITSYHYPDQTSRPPREGLVGEIIILLFKVLPFVVMWAAFTGLYIFMPNTRVNFRAALVGGILGGTLWQLAQWVYVNFQVGVTRYNAIYGTLAALPIFMVWIYVSWLIVLFGLEVTYARICAPCTGRSAAATSTSPARTGRLTVLLVTAKPSRGEKPWG
jgi:membrane protein